MTAVLWCLLAVAAGAGGSMARDRWPAAEWTWWARVAGASWFFGVVLGLALLS